MVATISMKKGIAFLLAMAILMMAPLAQATESDIVVSEHVVAVDGLSAVETIMMTNTGLDNVTVLSFWVQSDVSEVVVTFDGSSVSAVVDGNYRMVNLTSENITFFHNMSATVRMTYSLPAAVDEYQKRFGYATDSFSVEYNDNQLCFAEDIEPESFLSVRLTTPTPAQSNDMYLILIGVLGVLVIVLVVLLVRKGRTTTKRIMEAESEEVLMVRKDLTVSLLKDLEKKHRAKEVSDDTYGKIRSEYKQQAVEAMKMLEDIKEK